MSVLSIVLKKKDISRLYVRRSIAIQLTGTYAAPDNVDFTTMTNPTKQPKGKFGGLNSSSRSIPGTDDITQAMYAGYNLQIVQNPTSPALNNYQLYIYTASGTALSGAIPSSLLGVDIMFDVVTSLKRD